MSTTKKISDISPLDHERIYSALTTVEGHATMGKELLLCGVQTELAKTISEFINDPFAMILKQNHQYDSTIRQIITAFIKSYLSKQGEIIESVFKTKTKLDDLHFCIVLKKDNTVNRNLINSFFTMYQSMDFAEKFPVYFQFIPKKLKDKIEKKEELF